MSRSFCARWPDLRRHEPISRLCRLETKPIVVLGNEDDVLCAGRSNGAHPLVGIEPGGVKDRRTGSAVSPFTIEESIGRKVNNDAKFKVLPCNLIRSRSNISCCRLSAEGNSAEHQCGDQERTQIPFHEVPRKTSVTCARGLLSRSNSPTAARAAAYLLPAARWTRLT